jgi:hypothetical protein
MQATLEDIRRHYSLLSDDALLATEREELTDVAKLCLDAEISSRGLKPESATVEPAAPVATGAGPEEKPQELVVAGTYDHPEEVRIAQALLRTAGIPSHRSDETGRSTGQPMGVVDLLVPAEMAEDAAVVLESQISDEELAAQAEAAAPVDDEASEESQEKEQEPDMEP